MIPLRIYHPPRKVSLYILKSNCFSSTHFRLLLKKTKFGFLVVINYTFFISYTPYKLKNYNNQVLSEIRRFNILAEG